MPRTSRRDYGPEKANQFVEPQELRKIVDLLCQDVPVPKIAEQVGRKTIAVYRILQKVETNYNDRGQRKRMIEDRLATVPSELDFNRKEYTKSEGRFFRRCCRSGRTLDDFQRIFHIPPETIIEWEEVLIGGWEITRRLLQEYNKTRKTTAVTKA